jgi:uncharacterized protein YkwD
MMRKIFCLAALLGTSVALADMPTPANVEDGKATTTGSETSQGQAPQPVRLLHRNGTLFGMLTRNNVMRRRAGLLPHRMSPALTLAAQDHANYMARTGQFSHYTNYGPQGRASKFGFQGGGVRENIAMGGGGMDYAFTMWQNSGAHYASIVSGTTDAGFGYAVSSSGTAYFVGVYATPTKADEAGETEEEIAKVLDEEKEAAEKLAAEKAAAEKDPNVKPASATSETEQKPASQVQPAAATNSAEDE